MRIGRNIVNPGACPGTFGECFQFHGCLTFIADLLAYSKKGGYCIKESTTTGGKRRIEATGKHGRDNADVAVVKKPEGFRKPFWGDAVAAEGIEKGRKAHAPGFGRGNITTGETKLAEVGQTCKGGQFSPKNFTTPDRTVGAKAGAVEYNCQYRFVDDHALP